jgi:DNA-binding Lrp family transcriptional regulator
MRSGGLTSEQKQEVIASILSYQENARLSNSVIAAMVGVSDNTVNIVRERLESTSQIAKFNIRIGKDGKARPATQKRKAVIGDGEKSQPLGAYSDDEQRKWNLVEKLLGMAASSSEHEARTAIEKLQQMFAPGELVWAERPKSTVSRINRAGLPPKLFGKKLEDWFQPSPSTAPTEPQAETKEELIRRAREGIQAGEKAYAEAKAIQDELTRLETEAQAEPEPNLGARGNGDTSVGPRAERIARLLIQLYEAYEAIEERGDEDGRDIVAYLQEHAPDLLDPPDEDDEGLLQRPDALLYDVHIAQYELSHVRFYAEWRKHHGNVWVKAAEVHQDVIKLLPGLGRWNRSVRNIARALSGLAQGVMLEKTAKPPIKYRLPPAGDGGDGAETTSPPTQPAEEMPDLPPELDRRARS